MDETSGRIIREQVESYSSRLLMELKEKGLPFSNAYTLVQGGSARFVRETWKQDPSFAALDFLAEIKANAMGCETVTLQMMIREERCKESQVS